MAKNSNSSAAPTKGLGKGDTKRLSAEEHAAIRRSKKASQNANARAAAAHKQSTGGSYIDGLIEDRRQEVRERKQRHAEFLEQQRVKQLAFRVQQASLAVDMNELTRLEKGTTASKMARAILGEFPTAEPRYEGGVKVSRTDAAVEIALGRMSDEDIMREKAINYGISMAKTALYKAFRVLESEKQ